MARVRRLEALAVSGLPEAWPVVAPGRLSVRPEARAALHAAAVSLAVGEWPSAELHAEAAARPVAERRVAAHEASVPLGALVRRPKVPDEWVQLSEQDLSAAVLSALTPVRFPWMAQPARVGPARIARAMASSSAKRQ
jgi:hypothetical protein